MIIFMFGRVVRLMVRKKLIKKRFLKFISDLVNLVDFLCCVSMMLKISVLRLFLIFINLKRL